MTDFRVTDQKAKQQTRSCVKCTYSCNDVTAEVCKCTYISARSVPRLTIKKHLTDSKSKALQYSTQQPCTMHYMFKRQELTFLDLLKNIATVGVLKGKLPPLTCKKKKWHNTITLHDHSFIYSLSTKLRANSLCWVII